MSHSCYWMVLWSGAFVLLCSGCNQESGYQLDHDIGHPLRFSQDGRYLVTAVGSRLFQLNVRGRQLDSATSTGFYRLAIMDVAYNRTHSLVAAGGYRKIHIQGGLNPSGGGGTRAELLPGGMIWSLDFSPDQRFLASSVGVYETKTWQLVKRFAPALDEFGKARKSTQKFPFYSSEQVRFVGFFHDGKKLLLVGEDAPGVSLLVFSVPDLQLLTRHEEKKVRGSLSMKVDLTPDGSVAMSGGDIYLFRYRKGRFISNKFVIPAPREGGFFRGVAFGPRGKRLAILSKWSATVWDIKTKKVLKSRRRPMSGPPGWLQVAWHPSGKYIVASRSDNVLDVLFRFP